MKFVVKFTNGFWKVFDTEEYTDVQKCDTLKEAETAVQTLNKGN